MDDFDEGGDDWEGEPALESEVQVKCPYCGETVEITIDSAGGTAQEYVQDCEICCRPWQVQVHYAVDGSAEVTIEETE